MRVLCIDDSCPIYGRHKFLQIGEIYEAIGDGVTADGQPAYVIQNAPPSVTRDKFPNGIPLYRKSRFIELDSIDETELVKTREVGV